VTDWYIDEPRSSTRCADFFWSVGLFSQRAGEPAQADAEQNLTRRMRTLLADPWQDWQQLETHINHISEGIERISLGR
jgi:hypothetical protein